MAKAQPPQPPPQQPSTDHEDIRAAANVQVTICTYLLTVGLAIIAAEGGLTTFYLEHRSIYWWGVAGLIVASLLVVVGGVLGGRALNMLSESGYYGEWDFFAAADLFNRQAIATLVAGLLVFAVAIWGSSPLSDSKTEASMRAVETRITILEKRIDALHKEFNGECYKQTKHHP